MYPTGIIVNTDTNRFHPVSFRPAPMPGNSDVPRYKSIGHHTAGFDTIEEAETWINENDNCIMTSNRYQWDGVGIPALVDFFAEEKA